MNFINGIEVGDRTLSSNASPWAWGAGHFKRMLWWWAVKVIGWVDHDKSGAFWDNVQLATQTNGATDASDPTLFTGSGFTTAMAGSYLCVHPTAAPATAGGFGNPERNGFYKILSVPSATQVIVEIQNGVHHLGLPLSESSLTYTVLNYRGNQTTIPAPTGDFAVIRGTGVGGDFDIRMRTEFSGSFYGALSLQASPYADWDSGSNDWIPSNRVTTEGLSWHNSQSDYGWVWAFGDLTQIVVWVRYFNTATSAVDSMFLYMGDITPFHPADDLKPVVCGYGRLGASLDEHTPLYNVNPTGAAQNGILMIANDNLPVYGRPVYQTGSAGITTEFHAFTRTTRSFHSGRFVRRQIPIWAQVAGKEELRGVLKNVDWGHFYGPRGPIPLGLTRDRIRFFTQMVGAWNGSKISRYVY